MRARLLSFAVLALLVLGSNSGALAQMTRDDAPVAPTAATPPATPPANLGALKPWLECISKSTGTVTAYFGWSNPALDTVYVPAGSTNKFVPDPATRSQTTEFLAGRSRYFPIYAFAVTFASTSSATWQLNGYQVSANSSSALCITSYECFVMTVASQTTPTAARVSAAVTAAATAMDVDASRILTTTASAGLGYYEIIFNVTSTDDTGNDATTPVLAMNNLFGDNVRFSTFIDAVVAAGLNPTSTEPMASGLEVEGTTIPNVTPSAPSSSPNTTPSSTPSEGPTAPLSPDSPVDTPSNDTSPVTPSTPRAANTPSGAPSLSGIGFSLFLAVLVFWAISCTCE